MPRLFNETFFLTTLVTKHVVNECSRSHSSPQKDPPPKPPQRPGFRHGCSPGALPLGSPGTHSLPVLRQGFLSRTRFLHGGRCPALLAWTAHCSTMPGKKRYLPSDRFVACWCHRTDSPSTPYTPFSRVCMSAFDVLTFFVRFLSLQ